MNRLPNPEQPSLGPASRSGKRPADADVTTERKRAEER
jgi:hypothetical protein